VNATTPTSASAVAERLHAGGLDAGAVARWLASEPGRTTEYNSDRQRFIDFWRGAHDLLRRLPRKSTRIAAETAAAATLCSVACEQRERFLSAHAETLYDLLTLNRSRFARLEDLAYEAAVAVPGLVPTREQVAAESALLQRDKEGHEIDQGIFLAHVLASERAGRHLCHAMLLPHPRTAEFLGMLAADGAVDLGKVTVERQGKAAVVTMRNPRVLNAEDDTTLEQTEIAVDVATLDPATDIAVLRGGTLEHPKYRGRRVFGSGINLTHLYQGKIPYLWFLTRDLGFVHKLLRGVARPDALPDDVSGWGIEKPWLAVIDGFAIGGHCQILLAMDYVLAAADAFLTLPARKEGIIPGAANLRLPRFTGDRIARQAIQYERKLVCDSPEGRLICDEIAPARDMDAAAARVVEGLTNAGAVSTIGNRRALRIAQEPLDLFRRYFSAYARDQAYCCFSPALIQNLERNWDAHNRKA
jgi:enoyl-CoA hydratase/carnithine racemase